MDPADVPAGLEDAILDVVVIDVLTRNSAGEPLGHPRAILGMNGLSPQPRLAIERLSGKPPEAFEARAHVQDPFRIQRDDPEDFGNGISQAAKRLFALGLRCVALIRFPHHWRPS